jgi:hypothetical protein
MRSSSLICLIPLTLAFGGDEARAQDQAPAQGVQLALDLPIAARDLRRAGVPEPEVKIVLSSSRAKGLSAQEAGTLIRGAERDVKERGPVDNLGAFVQSKLDEGLRGKELAAAIHAEHEARGKGQGKGRDDHGKDDDHGRDDHEKSDDHGKSGDHGKGGKGEDRDDHDDHGRGADHGKEDDRGKSKGGGKDDDKRPPEVGGGKPTGGAKAQSGGSRR